MDGLKHLGSQLGGDNDSVLVTNYFLGHVQIFLVSVIMSDLLVKVIAALWESSQHDLLQLDLLPVLVGHLVQPFSHDDRDLLGARHGICGCKFLVSEVIMVRCWEVMFKSCLQIISNVLFIVIGAKSVDSGREFGLPPR